ncbi:MAG: hypothetical protein EXS55_00825 [Candidatus Magasanikbacteria bacterium]|nr:hypothetical protein [Candidatus Magasanikbacteria bacterium]
MITYRLATQPPLEPSVKFYKIIALSFLAVTIILLALVIFMTSKKAVITIVAKNDIKSIALAVGVGAKVVAASSVVGSVQSQIFPWSEDFHPTGNKTVAGIATGAVVIFNKTKTAQSLVKTTRFLTPGGALFRLSEGVTVPANGQITARVYADQKGAAYDIAPSSFTIPGLVTDKQKVIFAESTAPMSGGVASLAILSADDIKSAELAYKQKVEEAFRKSLKDSDDQMAQIVTVLDSHAKADHKAGEEVTGFTVSGTSTIVVVRYTASELVALVNKQIADKVDAGAERFVAAGAGAPQVTVVSFNAKEGTAELSVRQDVGVTLEANGDALSAEHFLSKKKADIERYVLGLEHVAQVDVKFSPSWMLSAPSVPDKIKVIVKNVQ